MNYELTPKTRLDDGPNQQDSVGIVNVFLPKPTARPCVLMVCTSHGQLGNTAEKTGVWLTSLAIAWWQLCDAGFDIHISSTVGGEVPIDSRSYALSGANPPDVARFLGDRGCNQQMATAPRLRLLDIRSYAAMVLPGGHGSLWDFAGCRELGAAIDTCLRAGQPVAAVCHGAAALLAPGLNGVAVGQGRAVTAFTAAEEAAVGLVDVVPYLLEARLRDAGARFTHAQPFSSHTVTDGALLTGQNPASTRPLIDVLIQQLRGVRPNGSNSGVRRQGQEPVQPLIKLHSLQGPA